VSRRAGASDGRLAADIARAAKRRDPAMYEALRLHLVEASAEARAAQTATLADVADRVAASSPELPESFEGVLIANELLDALPVHQVVMRESGLRETYVAAASSNSHEDTKTRNQNGFVPLSLRGKSETLRIVEGPLSTPELTAYLDRLGVALEPGWRVEINLRAIDWIRDAARRLRRGFIVLIDYGHEARELYSAGHSSGTLTTFARHRSAGPEQPPVPGRRSLGEGGPSWLRDPGEQDLTSHVDFTSVRAAAEAEGMTTIGFLDQTYFLLGLLPNVLDPQSALRNPQSKTLLLPGGLGSTLKVLILGKGVGAPALLGCSFKVRVT
jgi:SAM-dependent MidA family methyltransferase